MPQVSAAAATGRARAALFQGTRIARVLQISQPQRALVGEGHGVAAIARGKHAVEQVDATSNRLENILRPADAHQVARFAFWQRRRGLMEDRIHLIRRLADTQATDSVALKLELAKRLGAFNSQSRIQSALNDSELSLIYPPMSIFGASRPADTSLGGFS